MRTPLALCLALGVLAAPLAAAAGPDPCYGTISYGDCYRWARAQAHVLPPDVQEIVDDAERQVTHVVTSTIATAWSAYCFVGGPEAPPAIECPP